MRSDSDRGEEAPERVRTRLLHLENAKTKTALAVVAGHARGGFLLDRSIYHAAHPRYHHAQPCDRGHVLAEGHKLKLDKVFWDDVGRLVHRTDGPLPAIGAKAQLHLDAPRRELNERAHAAAHLLARLVVEARGTMLSPPAVVGGGEARLHARFREDPQDAIPKILTLAVQRITARTPITTRYAPRDDIREHDDQGLALDAIMPGEPTLRWVTCGGTLPCDAPMPDRTSDIGTLQLKGVRSDKSGTRFGVRVG